MRYLHIIILALGCSYCGYAQNNNTFRSDFLSETKPYFSDVTITENGELEVQVDSVYMTKEIAEKGLILEFALKKWDGEMIFIHSGYIREVWRRDINTGAVSQVGVWNMNDPELFKHQRRIMQTTNKHPCFLYGGAQSSFNSENFNLLFNARVGFFLLLNTWDLALSESFSFTTTEETVDFNIELGLLSKVYFPIKKAKLSPYVGTGVSLVITDGVDETDDIYFQTMFLTGVSWYIGPGSLDLGTIVYLNFKDGVKCTFNLSLGYTFMFR
jgi:hypothetical protein